MSVPAIALLDTSGFLVADARGRVVGRVECPMYGTQPDVPDALSVRKGFFARRRRLVPAEAIDQIDGTSGVIGLRVERDSLRSFLYGVARDADHRRPFRFCRCGRSRSISRRTTASCGKTQQLAVGRQFGLACRKATRPEIYCRMFNAQSTDRY
jgi:hypothetical protein